MLEVISFGYAAMKGTRHLPQQDATLTASGATGDRRVCLIDVEQQKVLRTVANSQLMALEARWGSGVLTLTFPGQTTQEFQPQAGESLICDYWGRNVKLQVLQTPANQLLNDYLNKPVSLALAETGAIIYGSPYSLIGTASMKYLADRLNQPNLEAEFTRLRPTFLVKTHEPFEEENWAGQILELRAGKGQPKSLDGVQLVLGEGIPRCAVIDFNPVTGVRDLQLFKELTKFRPRNERGEPLLGVFAELG